uniref:Uncharacterized protein MANES_15G066000 n=1 Tax=Rhizophora mucronata TaxID=61149 RepID=A0A2P2KSR2_RHIMU
METAVDNNDRPDVQTDGVVSFGERRGAENGEAEEVLEARSAKRAKTGAGEMSRVAEILLVLSAMAGLRGGRSPTDAELDLMAEARAKLAVICQDLAPKELVARDGIGTVIEDLGLNWKAKDQRLGFRGNRISIKEKVLLAKRKIEDSKKFAAASQPSIGSVAESRWASNMVRMFPSDKQSNPTSSSGGPPVTSHPYHMSAPNSTSVTHLPTTEVRASVGFPSHNLGRDSSTSAFPKVDRTQMKSEGAPKVSSNASQLQANSSTNQPLANTWSIQPHSTPTKSASEIKMANHSLAKVDGTADLGMSQAVPRAVRDQAFRPSVTQTAHPNLPSLHQPIQGMKYAQPSTFFNNHQEIAKIVQKLLQPKLPEHPTWTPPSREYMNKALTCQMCKLTINEVETLVVCDACEKGFHLKCLEAINQKGIPRGEWHCMRCIALSNGKPFPPKYGRVMRSIAPTKGPSSSAGSQSSSEKKDMKVNQENVTANVSSAVDNPVGSGGKGSSTADLNTPNAIQKPGTIVTSRGKDVDPSVGTFPNKSTKPLATVNDSSAISSSIHQTEVYESLTQEERSASELKCQASTTSYKNANKNEHLKTSDSSQYIHREVSNCAEHASKIFQETWDQTVVQESRSKGESSACTSGVDAKQSEQHVGHAKLVGRSENNNDVTKDAVPSSNGFNSVEWIGNALKILDGKTFYKSCCINGVTYKVHDHALFRSSHDKLIPSKLQVMWEDAETGSKWIVVNQCYFPANLPEGVGHPCAPESNEVYESNHENRVMASLIQGPCRVLPPTKFKEENERRSRLGNEANSRSGSVFLCKWFYDELKGNFKPVFD